MKEELMELRDEIVGMDTRELRPLPENADFLARAEGVVEEMDIVGDVLGGGGSGGGGGGEPANKRGHKRARASISSEPAATWDRPMHLTEREIGEAAEIAQNSEVLDMAARPVVTSPPEGAFDKGDSDDEGGLRSPKKPKK